MRLSGNFNFKKFFKELGIPHADQPAVKAALQTGVAVFRADMRAHKSVWPESELLELPLVLGYGIVEVIRNPGISRATQLTLVDYAMQSMRPLEEAGILHGLPSLLSFLAGVGTLEVPYFRSAMLVADIEGELFDDWQTPEATHLLDWIVAKADLPDAERQWWVWYILTHCEQPALGKSLLQFCVAHPGWTVDMRRALCRALLAKQPNLQPPPQWRVAKAAFNGDQATMETALAELPPEDLAMLQEIRQQMGMPETGYALPTAALFPAGTATEPADADLWLDPDSDDFEDEDYFENELDPAAMPSFNFIRSLFRGDFVLVPAYIKRQAVTRLAALGEDPLTVCQTYLGKHDYYTEAINQGVADVLQAHRAALSDTDTRALIERGVQIGVVQTRKAFYALGAEFFGADYWGRAAADNAKSIRDWAAKQSAKPAPRRKTRQSKTSP